MNLTVTLEYQSFHTENPTAVYPGGLPIELPLAEVSLDSRLIDQTQMPPARGSQVERAISRSRRVFRVLVTMQATYQGQSLPLPPVNAALAISGQMESTDAGPRLEVSFEIDAGEVVDLPVDDPLPAFPFSLPTIVPPGSFCRCPDHPSA